MPGIFGFAIIVLVVLGIGRNLGCRNGFVAHVAFWFVIGMLSVPILLLFVGCLSLFSAR